MKCYVRGYKGAGFGSGFIKKFTRSKYSHVSLVFDMGHTLEEVEAIQGKGVIRHPPYSREEKEFDTLVAPLSEEQIIEAQAIACSLVGAAYDWQGVVSFLLHRTKHTLDKFFCSEMDAYVLYKVGYPLSRKEPYTLSPDDVMASYRLVEWKD